MSDEVTLSARWDAMKNEERIAFLAKEVMEWKVSRNPITGKMHREMGPERDNLPGEIWNPLTDWNHWREVEVEACRNGTLWHNMMHVLGINTTGTGTPSDCSKMYVRSPLQNRARALYLAYHAR